MKVVIALTCLSNGNSLHMTVEMYNVHESIILNVINIFVRFNVNFLWNYINGILKVLKIYLNKNDCWDQLWWK
jgi:hypothetical protein